MNNQQKHEAMWRRREILDRFYGTLYTGCTDDMEKAVEELEKDKLSRD